MFSTHRYAVSDRAYLLHYYPVDKTNPSVRVQFTGHVDEVKIDIESFKRKLKEIVDLLNGPYPGYNLECPNCLYFQGRNSSANHHHQKTNDYQQLSF